MLLRPTVHLPWDDLDSQACAEHGAPEWHTLIVVGPMKRRHSRGHATLEWTVTVQCLSRSTVSPVTSRLARTETPSVTGAQSAPDAAVAGNQVELVADAVGDGVEEVTAAGPAYIQRLYEEGMARVALLAQNWAQDQCPKAERDPAAVRKPDGPQE